MAPVADPSYFPPLDKCLSGECSLISWETAYDVILDYEGARQSAVLESFFSDETSVEILRQPWDPFQQPSPQSKSRFETKTAAIHVTPSENGHYNINEIKEDALWLSKETKIDEVAALRIAILEWQRRPTAQLRSGFTEEEAISIQDVAGASTLDASTFMPKPTLLAAPQKVSSQDANPFSSPEQRRLRLLQLYLSERLHILKVGEAVIVTAVADKNDPASGASSDETVVPSWIRELGRALIESHAADSSTAMKPSFLSHGVRALQVRLDNLNNGSGWHSAEVGNLEVEDVWAQNQITEMMLIMRLLFIHIDAPSGLASSAVILAWYRFVHKYGFFSNFQPADPSQQELVPPLQSLVAIVSLCLLKLPQALEQFTTDSVDRSSSYILDVQCTNELNSIFIEAASQGAVTASPALFAWSIIAQTLRSVVSDGRAERDHLVAGPEFMEDGGSSNKETPRQLSIQGTATRLNRLEEVLEAITDTPLEEDPIEFMAISAVNGSRVYEVIAALSETLASSSDTVMDYDIGLRARLGMLELIRTSLPLTRYGPDILLATLAVLDGDPGSRDVHNERTSTALSSPVDVFLQDTEVLVPQLLQQSQLRCPFEMIPYLKLLRALSDGWDVDEEGNLVVVSLLEATSNFTQVLPTEFREYEPIPEDDNQNCIRLLEDLNLFFETKRGASILPRDPKQSQALSRPGGPEEGAVFIPRGTIGYTLNNSRPFVVTWRHEHSTLQYLSNLLSTALRSSDRVDFATRAAIDRETVSEIVGLLTALLTSSLKAAKASHGESGGTMAAQRVLEEASDGLECNKDIVTVIFDIFEQELEDQLERPGLDGSLEVLINCLRFMHTLLAVLPGRVWPLLTRSHLLEVDGSGGSLAVIVTSTEMMIGRYDFLIGAVRVFEALVEDAILHAVARKTTTKELTRFSSTPVSASGTSNKVMSKVLFAFQRTLVDVFQSIPSWKFVDTRDKLEINTRILATFDRVLRYTYGFDDTPDTSQKITGVLASAANYLIDVFLSATSNDLPSRPILNILYTGITTPRPANTGAAARSYLSQTCSTLAFITTLLSTGLLLDIPSSHLEAHLFKALPLLVRLYSMHESYKSAIVILLDSLVRSAGRSEGEPASLVGHLGPETAKCFLRVLSEFHKPLPNVDLEVNIWRLLSSVVSHRQQWFAIYILTGSTPRDSLRSTNKGTATGRSKPLITYALDQLSGIQQLDSRRATALLEFVSLAQSHWPWAANDVRKHPKFLSSVMDYIGGLVPLKSQANPEAVVRFSNENRMAAYSSEILAMYLHEARQIGDVSMVRDLIPKLSYLRDNGVTVSGYNSSLHANLKRNFESKFPNCTLSSFKRTLLMRAGFGSSYVYDLGFANKLLSFSPAWTGSRNQGFSVEVARANINLSLVESQVMLLKGWKLLAIELSNITGQEPRLQKQLARVIADCLSANTVSNMPHGIFKSLVHIRVDLAFILIQKLAGVKSQEPEVVSLFLVAWETVRTSGQDFEIAFAGEGTDYYRILLRILFLSLQAYVHSSIPNAQAASNCASASSASQAPVTSAPAIASQLLEILTKVVAVGFRAICTQLHELSTESSNSSADFTSDFVLLTALLQTVLRIPGTGHLYSQIAMIFANNNTVRYATSLFSWSDRLALANRDPIYGELSILFLLELSSIPLVAQQLAVEGILSQLSIANISNYFRRPNGMGPFDEPTRMFSVWTRGILPLCLNVLSSVGAPIAEEIVAFLNQFPTQLSRAATAFENRAVPTRQQPFAGSITPGIASETHSLALISLVVEQFRMVATGVEIPSLNWDRAGVKEDVEALVKGRRGLRERIIPTNEREAEMTKAKPIVQGSGSENKLEERIMQDLAASLECLNVPIGT
ncbi:hypothetical protein LTR04_001379 [Oleoguttula sp. CCFEE 6159]|nr:hypothetical protein LTR04_001379 [Oleoguttula sp. CCFEE 6159]